MTAERIHLELARPVFVVGSGLDQSAAAMIMIHGRGASAQDILTYVPRLDNPDFVYLAPQAADNSWYPNRFSSPLADNEPGLTSSLTLLGDLLSWLAANGMPPERTVLFGFSQGACLVLEYAARHARRYAGVVGLSGGLIGPDDLRREDAGSLSNTPTLLGCSDTDPHIPEYRVQHAADVLRKLGGSVELRLYPQMDHTVNQDEIDWVRELMAALVMG